MQEENSEIEDNEEGNEMLHLAAQRLIKAQAHSVLLVEDTAAHAAIIRRALDPSLWVVEHVTRASDALASFEQDPERIVLLDLSLPDSDGLKLLARMLQINVDAPIIVVTATDQVSVSVDAMKKGAWDYVVKSDPKESAENILSALDRAWKGRLRSAESNLIDRSRLVEMVRAQRLEAIESIVKTLLNEVNNPLSGVMALSQLLQQKGGLDADLQRLADGIVKSAGQVAEVVRKLKTVSEEDEAAPSGTHRVSEEETTATK